MATYPLLVNLRRPSQCIKEIAINSCFIDAIELPLEVPKVGFAKRPCLSERKLFELVPDGEKLVVCILERWCNATLSAQLLAQLYQRRSRPYFDLIRVTHRRFLRNRVPIKLFASGAGSGCVATSCILSTISASFSSVVPVVSYARIPYSLSSSWTLVNSPDNSSTSSFGN